MRRVWMIGLLALLSGCANRVDARLQGCQDAMSLRLSQEGSGDEFTVTQVQGHFTKVQGGIDELQGGMVHIVSNRGSHIAVDAPLYCSIDLDGNYLAAIKH